MVRTIDRGFFVTLEGIEGCGKSSHSRRLWKRLVEFGYPGVLTHEPGGTPVGEAIRKIVLDPSTGEIDPLTEVFLFEAARREHVVKVIRPALERGNIVLCVRFTDSTLAYQGFGRGLPHDVLENLNRTATENLIPDLTLFLDVEPEEGLRRSLRHTDDVELRFEREFLSRCGLLEKIREGFYELCRRYPERFVRISTMEERDCVFQEIIDVVVKRIMIKQGGNGSHG
ncbi:MAG TPA: dTMP kinase [Atribacteraceae bacterium]|nr:dTMP kinase [Atribacteraceae bacterium]